ncbi:MAG: hypothetical protein H7336_11890, partial [Bacteriovorax sp.]|nr:hypothetical protein [Bacteriovorax sp.]
LLAEGKKITPLTIEEKKAEFVEKKLEPTVQTASLSQSREAIKSAPEAREEAASKDEREFSGTAPNRDAEQFRKTFIPQFAKSSSDTPVVATTKIKKVAVADEDSRIDEMKKLRSELADAINKVKGTSDEKLAAIADNNEMAIKPKGSERDTTKKLNQGEKDRLDSYRESLSNWESRLRNWQGQLSDRDVRANSGNPVSANDGRLAPANGDQSGAGSSGSGSNAKLTKTTVAGAAGAKADGTGERAPGSDKADLEQGVVSSEKLATLQKESLSNLGIVASDSFIIKVRYQDKIYSIPVKTFNHEGRSMFVPLLNDKNRELAKIVYDSPLFRDYRNYQIDRQYKLEKL